MNINYENVKAAYYRGQNILKIYSGSTMEWEYETEPMEQTTKQIWYNSVSGDVVEPYAASAMGTVVSNTAYETKCVLEFASDITAIGANAFSGCTDLEYVSLPVSATSIGDNAFDGCSALDGIYMPSVQSIGRESFKDCTFSAFTVPTSVTAITADAFKGVAIEEFNYNGTKAQWSGITYGDFWDDETWLTRVVHCTDGDIELYQIDYSKRYLEFVATSGGTFQFSGSSTANTISYSIDQGKTWSTPAQVATVNVNSGDSVMWKGSMRGTQGWIGVGQYSGTATFDAQGNTMSLLYGDNYKNQTSIPNDTTLGLLFQNSKIVSAENLILPATTVTNGCYYNMFVRCTSLTTAPQLPATSFSGQNIYRGMFAGCTSLTQAPSLPASTLVHSCYAQMFEGCTSLTQAPQLQATTLALYCYNGMFSNCTSLTQAPQLLATTLAGGCYESMFNGCTSLTTAPELIATKLETDCYKSMFQGCTSLAQRPIIHATTLAGGCYDSMYSGTNLLPDCSNIDFTSASAAQKGHFVGLFAGTKITDSDLRNILPINPQTNNYWLPVTTSVNYNHMFEGCTSLTTAPELPATTLANGCYSQMFEGCTSLTTAPQLPATTLKVQCYYRMFSGCTSLNYIKMLATDISATICLWSWVDGVANSGTFVKAESMTTLPTGTSGIPNGWTVQDFPPNHLRFVAKSGGTFNFSGTTTANTISYSTDSGDTWSTPAQVVSVNVNSGDTVYWKGNMTPTNNGIGTYSASTASFDAQGNIMSLLYGDSFKNQTSLSGKNNAFRELFYATKVINAANVELPATSLSDNCYYIMFAGCTSLTQAPSLPASTLAQSCYAYMFSGCTALANAPVLSATTLTNGCYSNMFKNCTSLTTAPSVLPATTLTQGCYTSMFYGCTSLTTAPALSATTLANNCYETMFRDCTSLTTAPDLLSTTLVQRCYYQMFYGCSSLNYIKMLATDISASACLNSWVGNVANSGTFVKAASMTSLPTGSDGIPSGWTVEDDSEPEPPTPQDYSTRYLEFDITSGGTVQFSGTSTANTISYSTDSGTTWSTPAQTVSINVSSGDTVMLKGNMNPTSDGIGYFSGSTASFDAKGNVMSLLYGDNFSGETDFTGKEYALKNLMKGTKVVNAENMILPATTLVRNCYDNMFSACTSLISAPELPATTLAYGCYAAMFKDCTSLETAPDLLAPILNQGYCYGYMFVNCSRLNYIKMTAESKPQSDALYEWVNGVQTTSGTFIKNTNLTLDRGIYGIPYNWTVEDDGEQY